MYGVSCDAITIRRCMTYSVELIRTRTPLTRNAESNVALSRRERRRVLFSTYLKRFLEIFAVLLENGYSDGCFWILHGKPFAKHMQKFFSVLFLFSFTKAFAYYLFFFYFLLKNICLLCS